MNGQAVPLIYKLAVDDYVQFHSPRLTAKQTQITLVSQ